MINIKSNRDSGFQAEPIQGPTKEFDIRTILTLTTGRVLTKGDGPKDNGFGNLYELMTWVASDRPATNQLGRFADEVRPWLYRWYPQLREINTRCDQLSNGLKEKADNDLVGCELVIAQWVDRMVKEYGLRPTLPVGKIPIDDHVKKDPYEELSIERGTDEGLIRLD